jgi:transposase
LEAFDSLTAGDALAVLGRAPTPDQGARLSLSKISSALKAAGRQRNIDTRAIEIQTVLRREHLTAPPAVAAAFGATTTAAVHVIAELNTQIEELETALTDHFETHPDADIYRSLPGLGVILGARVLGEFGDDPNRYTTAKFARTTPEHRH